VLSQLSYAPPHITNAKISIAYQKFNVNGKLTLSNKKILPFLIPPGFSGVPSGKRKNPRK
jgi:hypothetical protein